jgi:hypothetical protein
MHGNVFTWCHDRWVPYPKSGAGAVVEDKEEEDRIQLSRRVRRGGTVLFSA